jgi:hypothetical protein
MFDEISMRDFFFLLIVGLGSHSPSVLVAKIMVGNSKNKYHGNLYKLDVISVFIGMLVDILMSIF